MIRHWLFLTLGALCSALVVQLAAPAADDVLTLVPDDALAVVAINRVGETQKKLDQLGTQLQVPVAALLQKAQLSVAAQPNVDPQGAVALAVVPDPDHQVPILLWFVATRDYAAFVKQFQPDDASAKITKLTVGPKELLATRKGGYAVLAAPGDRKVLEKVLDANRTVAAATTASAEWRTAQDAYALALPAGIKFAQQQLLAGLAMGKAQIERQGGEQAKTAVAGLELYETLFRSLDKEVSQFLVGLRIAEDGAIHVASRTLPAAGGTLEKLAKEIKPAQGDLLAGLPADPYVVAGGGVMPEGAIGTMMELSMRMMKAYPGGDKLTEEQLRKMVRVAQESMKDLRSMAMMMGAGKADEPLYGNTLFVMRVKNAEKYFKEYARLMEEMGRIGKESGSPLFSYQVEQTTIAGKPALKVAMNLAGMMGAGQPPEAKKMMELMFGTAEQVPFYLAVANPHTIVGTYLSPESLERALRTVGQAEAQLMAQAGNRETIERLPKGAQWVGLWSPRGTLQMVRRMMTQIVPNLPVAIPEFPETSPIGIAGKLSPAGLETELVLPPDVLKGIADTVRQASGAKQQL
jgi:hypothetical protein